MSALKAISTKIGYVFALVITVTAVLVVLLHLFTPILNKHRDEFERYASEVLHLPVKIQSVEMSWYGYQPEITLNAVTILNHEAKKPILQIKKASLFFSIPKTIFEQRIVPSGIMLSGTDISIRQSKNGEYALQGFPQFPTFNENPFSEETSIQNVLGWLAQQPFLILNDIDIHFIRATGEKYFVTLENLNFEYLFSHHTIQGKAVLHQQIPTKLSIRIRWVGDEQDPSKIKAKGYFYVSGLSLPQWLKEYTWQGFKINKGIVSAKIWTKWEKGALQKVQSIFQSYDLDFYSESKKLHQQFNRLSGNVGWQRNGDQQIFAGNDILMDLPSHLWPVNNFYIALAPDTSGALQPQKIQLGYLDLEDTRNLLSFFPEWLPDSFREKLKELSPTGSLQKLTLAYRDDWHDFRKISLNANYANLSILPWKKFPGFANLSGNMQWDRGAGKIVLNSKRTQFSYDEIFSNKINMNKMAGDLEFSVDPTDNWMVHIPSLQMENNDLALKLKGDFIFPHEKSPEANLIADFNLERASHIVQYLPMRIFDKALVEWISQAFHTGEVVSGHAEISGPLNDFPFDAGNGKFLIQGQMKNVDLHFAPEWPSLTNMNGQLVFAGRKMTVDVKDAKTAGILLKNIHGELPDLGGAAQPILTVHSNGIETDIHNAIKYVHASPLESEIGKMFHDAELLGPMALNLSLTVPLFNPDQTKVDGHLFLKNVKMKMLSWNLGLTNLNGEIQFTENGSNAQGVNGLLFNKPFKFNLATIKNKNAESIIRTTFTSNLNVNDIENWLKLPSSNIIKGSAEVSGNIDLSLRAPIVAHLHSNLAGVALDLPDPYGKKSEETKNLAVDIISNDKQLLRMKLSYANLINSAWILKHEGEKFNIQSGVFHFGPEESNWPTEKGLLITGKFAKLDWNTIKSYQNQSLKNNFSELPAGINLRKIDIETNSFVIGSQNLPQVRLQVTPVKNNWDVNISSPDVVGTIKIPHDLTPQQTVVAQFEKLKLHSSDSTQKGMEIDLKSLPSISLVADNVQYDDMLLGQITFKGSPSKGGMTIDTFRIDSPYLNLQGTGDWTGNKNKYVTHLEGVAATSNLSKLLNSYDLGVNNFVANHASFNFNFNWDDAPFAPSFKNLDGNVSLAVGPGRIADIGKESGAKMDLGRMLSIFSLQTIPRRLALNFSDLFQSGYSFDSVLGDFTLRNGNAYTSNFRFDGPVAKVAIKGEIGLKNKDYNFRLIVTPYVTSSLPVAATLLGPVVGVSAPILGVAALAVSTVIGPQVSKVTTYYYAVTGPWSNPIWRTANSATTANR